MTCLNSIVNAEEYGTLKCQAGKGVTIITWEVKADESGSGVLDIHGSIEMKDKTINSIAGSYAPKYTLINNWTDENFKDKKENELSCPPKVWIKQSGGGHSTSISYTPSFIETSEKGYQEYIVEEVYNNHKPAQDKSAKTRVCEYDSSSTDAIASGHGKVTSISDIVTVTKTEGRDKLDITVRNGYKYTESGFGPLDPNLISFDESIPCPELFVICGQNGNDKYCTITKEYSNPNTNVVEGEAPESADSLFNKYKSKATLQGLNQKVECDGIFVETEGSVFWLLQKLLNYIRLLGPILVIVLSAVDFIKAIASSDENAMKKSQGKLTIRFIAVVALFLVPTIIELALNIIGMTSNPKCILK